MAQALRIPLLALLLVAGAGTAAAQARADPSQSPACERALAALQAREDAATRERTAGMAAPPALTLARRQAAQACLGGPDPAASAVPRSRAPTAIAPPVPSAAAGARTAPTAPPAAAPARVPPPPPAPLTLGACDATGCWASDGTRLQRAGPNLIGPRGLCTTSGPFVQCP